MVAMVKEVMDTQVEVEVDVVVDPLVGMEALMVVTVGIVGTVEELGLVRTSPCSPSPPGAWARVPGGKIMVATEEEEVESWWMGRDHRVAATRGMAMAGAAAESMAPIMTVTRGSSL